MHFDHKDKNLKKYYAIKDVETFPDTFQLKVFRISS